MSGWDVRHEQQSVGLGGYVVAAMVTVALFGLVGRVTAQRKPLVVVDEHRQVIEIAREIDGRFQICDGPDGACFALRELRAATAMVQRTKESR